MTAPFPVEILGQHHDRKAFDCGVPPLDRYLREQATQDMRRRAAACYVAVDAATGKIVGYYTLSADGILLSDMPESLAKRLPRYPSVPVARRGRIAVDITYRGQKLGAMLLWDAASRAARSELAVFALVVDAKHEAAGTFYRHHGFVGFGSLARQLLLPLTNFAGQKPT